jgi:hypothetical protein
MLDNAKAPAEVLADDGRGEWKMKRCANESTPPEPKRKIGSVWRVGRYLCRKGSNGNTIFDTRQWTGEPLPRRGA